jgi:ketosteroid isomerase-like protein
MRLPSKLGFVVVTIFLFAVCEAAIAQSTTPESDKRSNARQRDLREIERLEAEWNRINEVSDPDGKSRLLADDSYHVGPSGRLYNKQQDVEDARISYERKQKDESITKFYFKNRDIRLYSDVAVVTATGWSMVTKDGIERRGNSFRVVHVWENRDTGWQLVVDQVTGVAR